MSNKLCERGMIGPATAPWMTRQIINISKLCEMPQSQEARTKSKVEIKNNRTSPKRFASQPVIGIEIAFATPNEVMTHVPWLDEAPKSPAIVGMATLAMVESNTCIKVASESANVRITSAPPCTGVK